MNIPAMLEMYCGFAKCVPDLLRDWDTFSIGERAHYREHLFEMVIHREGVNDVPQAVRDADAVLVKHAGEIERLMGFDLEKIKEP